MRSKRVVVGLVMFALSTAVAVTALADDAASSDAPPTITERVVNGHRVYDLGRQVVHGDVQRPYAFAVSGRGPLGYSGTEAREHFVNGVVSAVRRAPF